MKRTLVQHRVKRECVSENQTAIRAVFEELRRRAPPAFQDAAFKTVRTAAIKPYGVQGGDWGSFVAQHMAHQRPLV